MDLTEEQHVIGQLVDLRDTRPGCVQPHFSNEEQQWRWCSEQLILLARMCMSQNPSRR